MRRRRSRRGSMRDGAALRNELGCGFSASGIGILRRGARGHCRIPAMNPCGRLLAAALSAALTVPLAAQQDVPMRHKTPVAPEGLKMPPLPDTPVRYETAEGQTIRVG